MRRAWACLVIVVALSAGAIARRASAPEPPRVTEVYQAGEGGPTLSAAEPDPALIEPPAQTSLIAIPRCGREPGRLTRGWLTARPVSNEAAGR